MISELMAMLDRLQGEVFFFIEDGPLKHKLIECYLEEEEAQGDILDFELDASIRIQRREGVKESEIEARLETDGFLYQTLFVLERLSGDETVELVELLRSHCATAPRPTARPGRNILRKKNDSGLLGVSAAAHAVGLSQRDLKALIPCSEIRIAEQEGEKVIEEYYWERDLIGRFASLGTAQKTGRETNREDVNYIAEWCCDGDRQWARDLISEFLKQRHLTED